MKCEKFLVFLRLRLHVEWYTTEQFLFTFDFGILDNGLSSRFGISTADKDVSQLLRGQSNLGLMDRPLMATPRFSRLPGVFGGLSELSSSRLPRSLTISTMETVQWTIWRNHFGDSICARNDSVYDYTFALCSV